MESTLEWILTNSNKADMIAYMASHPEEFEGLVELTLDYRHRCSWRASWLLWSCMEWNDPRIGKYQEVIIGNLLKVADNQQRELLQVILRMEIANDLQGRLFDICTKIWKATDKKPSVRHSSFRVLSKIAHDHEGLQNELKILSEDEYLETLSSTVRKSINKLL